MENTTPKSIEQPRGMAAFIVIVISQIVSILGSGMTQFGLTIWMYEQTKSATALGMMTVAFITPFLLLSPIAGVMVDRYNRKLMMMVSDLAAGLSTVGVLLLFATGHMQFWYLYIAAVLNGIGNTFQWPAYSAAISTMVSKEQYRRANGMMSLMESGPNVVAPLLAGALLPFIKITGIMVIDVATFIIAIGALLWVFIPQPVRTQEGQKAAGNIWKEAGYGFSYIFKRPSLLGLQMIFLFGNLFAGIGQNLLAPMILAHTNNNSLIFGSVQTAGATGAVAGGILMSIWGGFKRRVNGVLIGWIWFGIFGAFLGLASGLTAWIIIMVLFEITGPLVNTSNQAIWQSKVPPDLQGRVFSARRLIAWITNPISPIIGGTLADFVLEPAMKTQGSGISRLFGPIFGTGPGSGMSLIIFFSGLLIVAVGVICYFVPAIRHAETILPDHDQLKRAEEEPAST